MIYMYYGSGINTLVMINFECKHDFNFWRRVRVAHIKRFRGASCRPGFWGGYPISMIFGYLTTFLFYFIIFYCKMNKNIALAIGIGSV